MRTITCTVPTERRAIEIKRQWRDAGYKVQVTHTDDGPVIVTGTRPDHEPPTAHELRDAAKRCVLIVLASASLITIFDIATTLIAKAGQ